jgi:hypothetical protein
MAEGLLRQGSAGICCGDWFYCTALIQARSTTPFLYSVKAVPRMVPMRLSTLFWSSTAAMGAFWKA